MNSILRIRSLSGLKRISECRRSGVKRVIRTAVVIPVLLLFAGGDIRADIGRGTATARRSGKHDGNRVYCNFTNGGYTTWNAWKYVENGYVIDIQPLVGMQLPIADYRVNGVFDGKPDTLTSTVTCATHANMDMNPSGTRFWGFEPIPGFCSSDVEGRDIGVAMSHQPQTWPDFWPDHPDWLDESGAEWNGYFGRGITSADQESYFMMDDNADEKMYSFHTFLPDSADPNRKGQGIRVSVRGLQWQNPLAQDIIFWIYEVTNISTTDYEKVSFGALVGTYVGGAGTEWNDDASFFNIRESIVYSWDYDNYISPTAAPSWQGKRDDVGYIGYAFLESPGHYWDGIDNDGDNKDAPFSSAPYFTESNFTPRLIKAGDVIILIDRKTHVRTTFTVPASDTVRVKSMDREFVIIPGETELVEGNMQLVPSGAELNPNAYDGYDNDLDGLIDENYQLHYRQFKKSTDGVVLLDLVNPVQYVDYFTGQGLGDAMLDEGRADGIDNDGDWDPLQDDVGADGKADTGDPGENDGVPTEGEPHFDSKDVDESDQIGLTSFDYFVPSSDVMPNDEADMWERLTPGRFDVPESVVENRSIRGEDGDFIFGSGYFPLYAGETQSFSIALVYGQKYDSVVRTKNIAQLIYDSNYNFPKAPDRPTVHAVGMDGKVILYWDRVAESSYDKVLGEYDFEGYKIYRSTDPDFSDCDVLTNGYGEVVAEYPLYQMDLDNDVSGWFYPDELLYDLVSGQPFYLGNNSGIRNTYIDEDVENGRTYYYAVCAYDRGSMEESIYPSENSKNITVDITGAMTFESNTVKVVPNAPVSDYIPPPSLEELIRISGISTAVPYFEVVDPAAVRDASYFVTFSEELYRDEVRIADAYTVVDSASGDTVIAVNSYWGPENGDVFDGVRLSFDTRYQDLTNVILDTLNTYWTNDSLWDVDVLPTSFEFGSVKSIRCPYDYMLVFHDDYVYPSSRLTDIFGSSAPLRVIQTNIEIFDITDPQAPADIEFGLLDYPSYPGSISNFSTIFLTTADGENLSWRLVFKDSNVENGFTPPGDGDTLFVSFTKPFRSDDSFSFTTSSSMSGTDDMDALLEKVRVVPNPYIVSSAYETALSFGLRGRGERILYFTHCPAGADVYIYSADGTFIRHLEHDEDLEDGSLIWDLKSREGLDIAFGVYFWVMEVQGHRTSGKIAVVK